MTVADTPDENQRPRNAARKSDRPHASRISELFVGRAKLMSEWGVLFWTIGPEHPETLKRETQINDLALTILRLQQEGSR